jgi:hypothetical protein
MSVGSSALWTRPDATEPRTVDASAPRPRHPATITEAPSARAVATSAPRAGGGLDRQSPRVEAMLSCERGAFFGLLARLFLEESVQVDGDVVDLSGRGRQERLAGE